MDPVFEVNPFLVRGAAEEVCKKLIEMLRGVVHMALVVRPWEQPVAGHQDGVTFFTAAIIDKKTGCRLDAM